MCLFPLLEPDNFDALRRKERLGCQFEFLVDQFGDFGRAAPDKLAGAVMVVLALHLNLREKESQREGEGKTQ